MVKVRDVLNFKRPVVWLLTIIFALVLLLGVRFVFSLIQEANLERLDYVVDDRGNYGNKITWDGIEYTAYGIPPTEGSGLFSRYVFGRKIGLMAGHKEDEVYEVKGQNPKEWLIVYPRILMSVATLYKEKSVTEIPPEFKSNQFEDVTLEVITVPGKYTPAMSSTPGIRMDIIYDGPPAGKILYEAKTGSFLNWEKSIITKLGNRVERQADSPSLYWQPNPESLEEDTITVSILGKDGELIRDTEIQIRKDDNGFFTALWIVDQFNGNEK